MVSLKEDPLRALRAIRFIATFDLKIDPELFQAMSSEIVKIGISTKVSKERLGHEFARMIPSAHFHRAMRLLIESELYLFFFDFRRWFWNSSTIERSLRRCEMVLDHLARVGASDTQSGQSASTVNEQRNLLSVAAFLFECFQDERDSSGLMLELRDHMFELAKVPYVLSQQIGDYLVLLLNGSRLWKLDNSETSSSCAMFTLREKIEIGDWVNRCGSQLSPILLVLEVLFEQRGLALRLETHLIELDLRHCVHLPPLVTGADVLKCGIPTGARVGVLLQQVRNWQILHSSATRERALEQLRDLVANEAST